MYPQEVAYDRASGVLELSWPDGEARRFESAYLRDRCQCAECRSARLRHEFSTAPATNRICALVPVGSYGVQLMFDDGHQRGIFPWAYLKGLDGSRA